MEIVEKTYRVPQQGIHPLVMLLLAFVGEIVAVPATEVLASRRQTELADSPTAGRAVDRERTNKPVSLVTEVAGRGGQPDLVVKTL